MKEFKKYRRKQIAELRPVTELDIMKYNKDGRIPSHHNTTFNISISNTDKENGSPRIGDMIARNPKNHEDQWLIAEKYFKDNFEEI